jgi:dephospho-CoA kinase
MTKNKKIIIGLIGEKGSGKGTVADYLMVKYRADHFGTSKILKRTIEDLSLPTSRNNLVKLALMLKEGFWPSVVIDALIKDMEKSDAQIVIADGIRMHGDLEPFRKKYGKNFYLIYVTAPLKLRYERTKKRKEKAGEDKTTLVEFLAEEGRLTEISIHEIGALADFTIENSRSEKDLIKQIDGVMKKIVK